MHADIASKIEVKMVSDAVPVSENALKTMWEKVALTWDNLVDKQTQLNQIIMVLINTCIIIIYIKYIAPKLSQKLRPDGSALAFCYSGPAKSRRRPSLWPGLARPILARLGPTPGLRPGQAQHYWGRSDPEKVWIVGR